jgi:hypothetical protein
MIRKVSILLLLFCACSTLKAGVVGTGQVYSVIELTFQGPHAGPTDTPSKDVDFHARFQHESGTPVIKLHGYWDGDGKGGNSGNIFKIRFTPTRPGRWKIVEVVSNRKELQGQKQGDTLQASAGTHPGFWEVDKSSAGERWYKRSNGSHPYIVANTLYTYLSETSEGKPNGSNIARDTNGSADYFKKLRFSVIGDVNPHPTDAAFLDDTGKQTNDGNFSHRPNPQWFARRVDLAVKTAYDRDMISDMIMSGVDTQEARSALSPSKNGGDPTPFLKYIAARYGAYPNVWFCLINEFGIRIPKYSPEQIIKFGKIFKGFLAYSNPLSVHPKEGGWIPALNTTPAWNDHVIFQMKLRKLNESADWIQRVYKDSDRKPVADDELSYQGAGDQHTEEDTIEAHVGAFLGGGYGATAHKSHAGERKVDAEGVAWRVNKKGQYLQGNFNPQDHSSADNLRWMREKIDTNITFWMMEPIEPSSIFTGADKDFRAMAWENNEYVLGTNRETRNVKIKLPPGSWKVTKYDMIWMVDEVLSENATGYYEFRTPGSRALLFHFKINQVRSAPKL